MVHMQHHAPVNLRTSTTEGCKICPGAKFPECRAQEVVVEEDEKDEEDERRKTRSGSCGATRDTPKAVQFQVYDPERQACALEYFGVRVAGGRSECGWIRLSSPSQVNLSDDGDSRGEMIEVVSSPTFTTTAQRREDDKSKMFRLASHAGACTSTTTMVLHAPPGGFNNVTWSTACESAGIGSTVTNYQECFQGTKYFNSFRSYPTFVGGKLDASLNESVSVTRWMGYHLYPEEDFFREQQYQSYGRCGNSDKIMEYLGLFIFLILDDYYFYLYATTLTIYFYICCFWLF
jgi:hypothetical protein